MRKRSIAAVLTAAALTIGGAAASAQASTLTLGFDPTNTGAYNKIDDTTYFVPRDSSVRLVGMLLDDAGVAGNSCFREYQRTFVTDFAQDGGISCPSDTAGGHWGLMPIITENTQFKAANLPDDNNAAAESGVITLLTAPEVHWDGAFAGKPLFEVLINGDAEDYAGTLQVRQGKRLVVSREVRGRDSDLFIKTTKRGGRNQLKKNGAFTLTLIPHDRTRWAGMTASGHVTRGKQGQAGPIL